MRAPRTAAAIASRGAISRLMLPAGADASALPLLIGRGLRGFCDGFVAVLLPAYLLALGFGQLDVGLVSSATLVGSAVATILVGMFAGRHPLRRMLTLAAGLMAATGMGFAGLSSLWPLLVVAFVGTLNPSSGDVSLFLPLELARLAGSAAGDARTAIFARYSLVGAVSAAVGALAAALPGWLAVHAGLSLLAALRAMFGVYALVGVALWFLYRRLPEPQAHDRSRNAPLGPSRGIVTRLALLFSVDAFAGGLVVNSLLSLWLMQRFGLSLGSAGQFFFWAGLLTAGSQLAAVPLARKIGLLNTMVFTHIPSSLCLIAAAFAPSLLLTLTLLLVRSTLSQMDVPTRTAYVMAVVTPPERPAAASFTAVPRSLASALGPTLAGALLAMGWVGAPLVACGLLKIAYDLTLLGAFRRVKLTD
ncbi:ABC transporter permease [Paraburkholderia phytofirmans OLGA172]|uniref:ABC transporter permease n=1 Tax=Paraburkholderia phytofirmans OLGA172 TaxID=1417228 RepID=A0A160FWM6_9BURK|nr:MFS transporter [Paraburkholderia phytofirmans]ANB77642.1 ABC transporter permease [Paraburkholderia phytofirmans OLGA172]